MNFKLENELNSCFQNGKNLVLLSTRMANTSEHNLNISKHNLKHDVRTRTNLTGTHTHVSED